MSWCTWCHGGYGSYNVQKNIILVSCKHRKSWGSWVWHRHYGGDIEVELPHIFTFGLSFVIVLPTLDVITLLHSVTKKYYVGMKTEFQVGHGIEVVTAWGFTVYFVLFQKTVCYNGWQCERRNEEGKKEVFLWLLLLCSVLFTVPTSLLYLVHGPCTDRVFLGL